MNDHPYSSKPTKRRSVVIIVVVAGLFWFVPPLRDFVYQVWLFSEEFVGSPAQSVSHSTAADLTVTGFVYTGNQYVGQWVSITGWVGVAPSTGGGPFGMGDTGWGAVHIYGGQGIEKVRAGQTVRVVAKVTSDGMAGSMLGLEDCRIEILAESP